MGLLQVLVLETLHMECMYIPAWLEAQDIKLTIVLGMFLARDRSIDL